MLKYNNNTILIQNINELPRFKSPPKVIYLDFETSSRNPKKDSLNPHHDCFIYGIAFTVDDDPLSYYIPYAPCNNEPENAYFTEEDQLYIKDYICYLIQFCEQWVNQNIKYDAHIAANELQAVINCWLVCTLTLSKIIDSDRIMRGGYGLDVLSRDWLNEDISEYSKPFAVYLGRNNKDYGAIPQDLMAPYAGQDVLTNRRLCKYITDICPQQCERVWLNEIELTKNIWQMERNGLGIDKKELQIEQFKVMNRLCKIDDRLSEILGRSINPSSPDDVYETICVQYGLPIIAFTKNADTGEYTTNPSFDKHVLKAYAARPDSPKEVIKLIQEYRELAQYMNLFLIPWQEVCIFNESHAIWYLHSIYNQAVRTGRMSCSDPNAQQLNKRAKKLIKPRPGYAFISIDYSQIEFRFIVHYINDTKAIQAFNENPDTDFHLLVASWCDIKRKPAKTVNFGVAFGEGKKKLIAQLAHDPDLGEKILEAIKILIEQGKIAPEQEVQAFQQLAVQKGEEVYTKYHATFPTLKPTAKAAESSLKQRYSTNGLGYVFNMYGRHRHLPFDKAYRAFNTLNQASAADLIKEQTNKVCRMIEGTEITLKAMVHDECLFEAPIEIAKDPRTIRDLVALMESPDIELRVPVRCSVGYSENNWAEAGDDNPDNPNRAKPLMYDKSEAGYLDHLRKVTAV